MDSKTEEISESLEQPTDQIYSILHSYVQEDSTDSSKFQHQTKTEEEKSSKSTQQKWHYLKKQMLIYSQHSQTEYQEQTDSYDQPLQIAMTVMDPYTGDVVAMVGGTGVKTADRAWNWATEVRPCGSAAWSSPSAPTSQPT